MTKFFGFANALTLAFLASGCTSVFYQPDRYVYFPPELNGVSQKSLYFNSHDGTRLHAWFFAAAHPKGTVVQFHGNAENMSSHYVSLVWLVEQGYNLFTFDYRGYGESLNDPDPEGVYWDGLAALDTAWKTHLASGAKTFVVYGQSLGGAIALRCLNDFKNRGDTSLLVMDSSFLSYKDVAQETLAKFWLTWPFSPLARVLVSDQYSAEESAQKLSTRLLVVHDRKDPVVKFHNGEEIFRQASSKKEFWALETGRHIATFADDAAENRKRFVALLTSLSLQSGP